MNSKFEKFDKLIKTNKSNIFNKSIYRYTFTQFDNKLFNIILLFKLDNLAIFQFDSIFVNLSKFAISSI